MDELNQKLLEFNRVKNLEANYAKTLMLLSALKDGSVSLSDFELSEGGWNLVLKKDIVLEQEA